MTDIPLLLISLTVQDLEEMLAEDLIWWEDQKTVFGTWAFLLPAKEQASRDHNLLLPTQVLVFSSPSLLRHRQQHGHRPWNCLNFPLLFLVLHHLWDWGPGQLCLQQIRTCSLKQKHGWQILELISLVGSAVMKLSQNQVERYPLASMPTTSSS